MGGQLTVSHRGCLNGYLVATSADLRMALSRHRSVMRLDLAPRPHEVRDRVDFHQNPLLLEKRPAIRIGDGNVPVEELPKRAGGRISRYEGKAISEIEEFLLLRRFALAEFPGKILSIQHVAMEDITKLHVSWRS